MTSDNLISASDAKRAARNVGALMFASIFSKGLLFLWQLLLLNWVSNLEYGIYSTILALYAVVAPLASLSMGLIAIREIAKKPETINQYASAMVFTQTALSGLAYLVMVVWAANSNFSEATVAYAAIAGLALLIDIYGTIANDLLIAQEQMQLSSMIEIAQIVVRLCLVALAIFLGWGLLGIYAATIVTSILRSSVLWGIQLWRGIRLEFPIKWSEIALPLLTNALPLAAAAMLSLGYDHADKLMTSSFLGEELTGYLTPAFLIHFGVIELLSTTVLVAIYPLMSRYYKDGENEIFGFLSEILARFMLIVALPMAIIFTIFAADFVSFLPESYEPTAGILRIFSWYTFLSLLGNVFSKALLIQNRQRYMLLVRGAALTLNIILNAILLMRYRDPRGAAVASVAAEALVLILLVRVFRAKGFQWRRYLLAAGRILLLGAFTALIMFFLGQIHWLLGLLLGSLAYLLILAFGHILSEEDWDFLYRLSAALPFGAILHRYWKRKTIINF